MMMAVMFQATNAESSPTLMTTTLSAPNSAIEAVGSVS
jgi:hypothetical protein